MATSLGHGTRLPTPRGQTRLERQLCRDAGAEPRAALRVAEKDATMAALHETYWFEFEAYLRRAGHTVELRRRRQHPHMRLNPADGVPISDAHFAVAITENDSDVHEAGARVQLVIEKKRVEYLLPGAGCAARPDRGAHSWGALAAAL